MNEPHLKASDYIAAALPLAGSLTLAEINALVGIAGGLIGLVIAVIIIFDTLVDPWIGALSDRLTGTRLGGAESRCCSRWR